MPTFGDFETVGEPISTIEEPSHVSTIWQARRNPDDGRLYAVKSYAPRVRHSRTALSPEGLDQDRGLEFLEGIKQHKKAHTEGGPGLAPIHGFGLASEGAWYATDFYSRDSLKAFVALKGGADSGTLRHVVHSVVTGCLALKRSRGHSHGNLKSSNVFLTGKPQPLRQTPLQLTDPYPASPLQLSALEIEDRKSVGELLGKVVEVQDLRAIGELILQLVEGRLIASAYDYNYPIARSSAWDRLGKDGEEWRQLCNKLLDPRLSPEVVSLESIEKECRPRASKLPLILSGVGAACLVAGGLYFLLAPRAKHPPETTEAPNQPRGKLTITVESKSRPYGSANPLLTGSLSSNSSGISVTFVTAATAASPVGRYPITPVITDPSHELSKYDLVTNSGVLIVEPGRLTASAESTNRVYGAPNPPLAGALNGKTNQDDISVMFSTTASSSSPVGNYEIAPLLTDPGKRLSNYTVVTNKGTLTVRPAELAITPKSQSRETGKTNPPLTGVISGLTNRDNITVTFRTRAEINSPPGEYEIEPVLNDPDRKLRNYTLVTNKATLTILKPSALPVFTLHADDKSRGYGEINPPLTGVMTPSNTGISVTFTTTASASSPVGNYDIVPVLADPGKKLGNYTVVTNKGTLAVRLAELVITPKSLSRESGKTNPPLTGTITGLTNRDNITVTFRTRAETNSPPGEYEIETVLNDPNTRLSNYSVVTNKAKLTILKPSALPILTVRPDDKSRLYGETNPPLTGTLSLSNSGIRVTFTTLANVSSGVGKYDISPVFADGQKKLVDYAIITNIGKLTIQPAELSITPNNLSREFGKTNPPLTGRISGLTNNDDVQLEYTTIADLSSKEGKYEILATVLDPRNRLTNYNLNKTKGTLTIEKAIPHPTDLGRTKNLSGIDFVWFQGLGQKGTGAYVAVNELSWKEYNDLLKGLGKPAVPPPSNTDAGMPANILYQDASNLVAWLDGNPAFNQQPGFTKGKWRLPTRVEYLLLTGISKGTAWTEDPTFGFIPNPDTIKELSIKENLAGNFANKPVAASSGDAKMNGLRYALGNVREWTVEGKPFGISYMAAPGAKSALQLDKKPLQNEQIGMRLIVDPD